MSVHSCNVENACTLEINQSSAQTLSLVFCLFPCLFFFGGGSTFCLFPDVHISTQADIYELVLFLTTKYIVHVLYINLVQKTTLNEIVKSSACISKKTGP